MRPVTVRRPGTAAAAIAAGLLMTMLAGCGSSPTVPSVPSTIPTPALAGGPVAGGATGPASPAPSACSLLRSADVLAVAATFRDITISIDGHIQSSQPPLNVCGFNQKGVSASDDGTLTVAGDSWAQLTVIADGNDIGDYSPDGPAIHGLGYAAYWDPGIDTVVVLVGQNVFQVEDDVPVNTVIYPNLDAVRRQAASALAAKILSHLQPAG
ncbi:hypothetical protein [Trebonia sp.]|uniref:hypothetical protein n=1 Tax=Trebonia sp. TaxID=2767075 RepID=UPI002631A309|nr:hypothetical protein [Trebonia sp.]